MWPELLSSLTGIINKIIPDPQAAAQFQLDMAKLAESATEAENQLLSNQSDVNKVEAASSNVFVAGWRPFIGWVCGVALGYTWIVAPLAQWVVNSCGGHVAMPALSPDSIYPIVTAMLGIAGMRTYEKAIGVTADIKGVVNTPVKAVSGGLLSTVKGWFHG